MKLKLVMGLILQFKRLQDAFNRINAKLDEDERMKHFNIITYDCVLMKNPGEVALALSVKEEAETRRILIKDIMPGVNILEMSPLANGCILPDDWLIKVRNEDIRGMPLLRVAQKLNDFRVPPSSAVRLTFERRVPKADGEQDDPDAPHTNEYYPAEEYQYTNNTSYYNTQTGSGVVPNMDMEFDIDESTPEERAASAANSPKKQPSSTPTASASAYASASASQVPRPPSVHTNSNTSAAAHLDPVTFVAAMAENEELRTEVDAKEQLLRDQAAKQVFLEAQLARMKSELIAARGEQRSTQAQLLDSQLRHRMTKEQMHTSIQTMTEVSQRVVAAQQAASHHPNDLDAAAILLQDASLVSAKTHQLAQRILQREKWHPVSEGPNSEEAVATMQAARLAVVTALMVDINGTFANQNARLSASSSSSLQAMLTRFEQRISSGGILASAPHQDDFLFENNTKAAEGPSTSRQQQLFSQQQQQRQQQQQPAQSYFPTNEFGMGDEAYSNGISHTNNYSSNMAGNDGLVDDFGGLDLSSPTNHHRGHHHAESKMQSDNQSLFGSVMSNSQGGSVVSGGPKVQVPTAALPRPGLGHNHPGNSNNPAATAAHVPSYALPRAARASTTPSNHPTTPTLVPTTSSAASPTPLSSISSPGLVKRRTQQFLSGGGGDMDFQ